MAQVTICDGCGTTEAGEVLGWLKIRAVTNTTPQEVIVQGEFHDMSCFEQKVRDVLDERSQAPAEEPGD